MESASEADQYAKERIEEAIPIRKREVWSGGHV